MGAFVSLATAAVQAQTIGDYSRAQRAVIESTIARNAVRHGAAGAVDLPPLPQAPASSSVPTLSPALAPPRPSQIEPVEPQVTVTGVVMTPSKAMAEVVVDGASYMLTAGQPVPGTSWRVATVSPDRVVLSGGRGTRGSRTILLASEGP